MLRRKQIMWQVLRVIYVRELRNDMVNDNVYVTFRYD